ncbi:MAG TPA: isopeptide-forming domain-containing fimbrial protein, partial [Pyrinomonadaceae bacterium]|nr:isopeptide-forming domain-containing fimbrial protein [Pyrinomonadaceae bacterium]
TTANDSYGATAGTTGASLTVTASQIPGASSGAQCVPVLTTTKTTSTASVNNSPTGTNATYTIQVANAAGRSAATNLTIADTLPTNFTYNTTSSITLNGGSTRPTTTNPTAGDAVPNWGTFTIPASGNVSITFTVKIAASVAGGTYQNPATATYTDPTRTTTNGTTTASYDPASSTGEDVTVVSPPNVGLVKSVSPSGTQPPGTDLTYTIAFTNAGGRAATSLVVTDPIPSSTDFKVGSATSALGTTGLTVVISYSNNGGTTWAYTPVSGAGGAPAGYDRSVTNVRWVFTGNLSQTSPNNTGSVNFTVRIR